MYPLVQLEQRDVVVISPRIISLMADDLRDLPVYSLRLVHVGAVMLQEAHCHLLFTESKHKNVLKLMNSFSKMEISYVTILYRVGVGIVKVYIYYGIKVGNN